MSSLTLVTGLWEIGRGDLNEGWSRSFDHYKQKFSELLKVENNMMIFGDSELESFVFQHREKKNTQFIKRSLDWFKSNEYYKLIHSDKLRWTYAIEIQLVESLLEYIEENGYSMDHSMLFMRDAVMIQR